MRSPHSPPPTRTTAPFASADVAAAALRLTWQGPLLGPSGYAAAGRTILQGLLDVGARPRCLPTWDHRLSVHMTREASDLVDVEMEGQTRYLRFDPPIEDPLRRRLLALTRRPASGVHVAFHPPADDEGHDYWASFRDLSPTHHTHVGFTMFETDRLPAAWLPALRRADALWVPSTFGRDIFVAAGLDPGRIRVMPLPSDPALFHPGVAPLSVGRPAAFTFLSIFEWTHRKGWDVLFRAFLEEFGADEDVRLLVRTYRGGGVTGGAARPIPDLFAEFLAARGLSNTGRRRIEFIDRMIPNEEMPALYRAADAFVLPSRGEGWGVPYVESLMCGVPVVATRWSAPLDFLDDGVAHLVAIDGLVPVAGEQAAENALYAGHRWAEPSLSDLRRCLREVHDHPVEARQRADRGRARMLERYTPALVADRVRAAVTELDAPVRRGVSVTVPRPLRLLFQARGDVFSLPGGDTEVLVSLQRALERRGHRVDFQAHRSESDTCDLVHVFNLDFGHALSLALQERPFVLTPLYEDAAYRDASNEMYEAFRLARGAAPDAGALPVATMRGHRPPEPELAFAARAATRLATVGASEAARLTRDFPECRPVVVPLAAGLAEAPAVDPALFEREYGLRDFVLCVGRLEARKNQLGLIEALRQSERPLVFINSKTHQLEYEALCRRQRRRGVTLFTGRVSREMLLSAYAAAAVHALPSFYEVPGLVTLEAAAQGTPVVAGRDGAIGDYLGEGLFTCDPGDPASIRAALEAALARPAPPALVAAARACRWETTAAALEEVYESVRAEADGAAARERRQAVRVLAEGELAYRAEVTRAIGAVERRDYAGAYAVAGRCLAARPDDPVAWQVLGEAALKGGDPAAAWQALERTRALNPRLSVQLYLYRALARRNQGLPLESLRELENGLNAFPFLDEERRALFEEYHARWRAEAQAAGLAA